MLEALIEEAYRTSAWHGPNLVQALRGVGPREAHWSPPGGLHTIRELVTHMAYWKSRVRRRVSGEKKPAFDLRGRDWFRLDGVPTGAEWRAEKERLLREHDLLMEAVHGSGGRLDEKTARMARGIALHDVYHAGQVRLIRKLYAADTSVAGEDPSSGR